VSLREAGDRSCETAVAEADIAFTTDRHNRRNTIAAVRIVVNADDFGSSTDTTHAISGCFEAGLLTSASIMVGMPETAQALEFARLHPQFSFGVHLQFVGDGSERPLSPARDVPALVGHDGRLLPTNEVRRRALLGRIPIGQIEQEAFAQIDYVQSRGVRVSHVDSHRHLHKFAPFRKALREVLPSLGVARVRNVQDTFLRRPVEHPTYWLSPMWRRQLMRSFLTTDHFYMPTTSHDPSWNRLADALPDGGTLEVGLHPGREDEWRRHEQECLAPFIEAVQEAGHRLVSWDAVDG
jgi:chitin disaccharide deacetylase